MNAEKNSPANLPPALRSREVQAQIEALTGRDWQLWSITLLLLLVLAGGMLVLVVPNLAWNGLKLRTDHLYLPQLFFGFVVLIVLFNLYIVSQKRDLNRARVSLIHELIVNEQLEGLGLVDPLTRLFNRQAMDEMLGREMARCHRHGSHLTLVAFDLDGAEATKARHGQETADRLISSTGQLLKGTFRGSDLVFRYGNAKFLVAMPETDELQAECALKRLSSELDHWNLENRLNYEISLTWGTVTCVPGLPVADALRSAERKLQLKRKSLGPLMETVATPWSQPAGAESRIVSRYAGLARTASV